MKKVRKYILMNEKSKAIKTLKDMSFKLAIYEAKESGLFVKRVLSTNDKFLFDFINGEVDLDSSYIEDLTFSNDNGIGGSFNHVERFINEDKTKQIKLIKKCFDIDFEILFSISKNESRVLKYEYEIIDIAEEVSIGYKILKKGTKFNSLELMFTDIKNNL